MHEHQLNLIMKQIVQEMVVDGYHYILILKKLQVQNKNIFSLVNNIILSFISCFFLAYKTQTACEQATTNRYQYKWGCKSYTRFFFLLDILMIFCLLSTS